MVPMRSGGCIATAFLNSRAKNLVALRRSANGTADFNLLNASVRERVTRVAIGSSAHPAISDQPATVGFRR